MCQIVAWWAAPVKRNSFKMLSGFQLESFKCTQRPSIGLFTKESLVELQMVTVWLPALPIEVCADLQPLEHYWLVDWVSLPDNVFRNCSLSILPPNGPFECIETVCVLLSIWFAVNYS